VQGDGRIQYFYGVSAFSDRFPTAFVTGGSSGLGKVLVEGLLSEGTKVWAGSRSEKRVVETGLDVLPVALDLSDGKAMDQFFAEPPWEKTPCLLINNAGFGQFGRLSSIPEEDLSKQLHAMLESAMRLSKHFLEADGGMQPAPAIVNVSSLAVEFPLPYLHGYNAVKGGLSGFSRSLAIEFPGGKGKPFVIDLRPGDYRTGFNQAVVGSAESDKLAKVWSALEHHLANGADPAGIWKPVKKALLRERSQTVRVGTVFQARVAPLLARIFPERWVAATQNRYYSIKQ